MSSARTVRLLVVLVLAAGVSAWRSSLFAQVRGDVRQYDPAFDGVAAAPNNDEYWGQIPAYVSAVSGVAQLDRAGDSTSDFEQVPLEVGDQLRTTRGRVEVLFSDGSIVALDEYSAVTVDADSTWRLHTGRVKVVARDSAFVVDATSLGVARLRRDGDYRISVAVNRRGDPEMELAVARGSAELENRLGRTLVREATRALTTADYAPSVPYAYATPRDDFERWTESLEADRYGVESARYLPVELRTYGGDFDRYGSWSHHHSHGWVWYPHVSLGWQPYHSGRWSFVTGFGYNWIGGSRWEWPTHHYGRWDRGASRWFWVPSRPVQSRRVGYAVPRRSFSAPVTYYSRPLTSRPMPTVRNNSGPRLVRPNVEPSRTPTRGNGGTWTQPSAPQPRVAIPRSSSAPIRETRPSTFPTNRPDDPAFRVRQAPMPMPNDGARVTRPDRETPRSARPETSARERQPSARPSGPPGPAPAVDTPSRSPSTGSRAPSTGGRLPDPQHSSARPPSGSRTPSASSKAPSGTAGRRGGGKR